MYHTKYHNDDARQTEPESQSLVDLRDSTEIWTLLEGPLKEKYMINTNLSYKRHWSSSMFPLKVPTSVALDGKLMT